MFLDYPNGQSKVNSRINRVRIHCLLEFKVLELIYKETKRNTPNKTRNINIITIISRTFS